MANEYYPMLSPLRENTSVNPAKASEWEQRETRFLNELVDSLNVGGNMKDIGHIDSIPDVWARPILFRIALFDVKMEGKGRAAFIEGLHERIVGEWRALLAMLALQDIRHIRLRAEAVHLGADGSDLAQVLTSLAPAESISDDTDWSDLYVLFYEDVPVALTSPTTLVSAAADYTTAFDGALPQPWSSDGKYLADPLPYLTADERAALAAWLGEVRTAVRDRTQCRSKENKEMREALLGQLEAYRLDALKGAGEQKADIVPAGLDMNLHIFRFLNCMAKGRPASAADSAVKIVPSQGRQAAHDAILVSPEMVRAFAESAGVPASQLVVWPGISANDVTDDSLAGGENQIGGVSLGTAVHYRPEDFFTERMLAMEPEDVCLASLNIEGMEAMRSEHLTPLPPVTPALLELFTPQEIAQRLSFESNEDGITVNFRFPLSGANGVTEYRFTKKYNSNDGIVLIDGNVPALEIWPNFRRAGWSKYYLYYENTAAENGEELGKNYVYVQPWTYGREAAKDLPAGGLANRYTTQLDGFPEALLCSVIPAQDGVAAAPVFVGAILLKEPPVVHREPELRWALGVDFGTSSTMLYYREDRRDPEPLALAPHLYQVLKSAQQRLRTFVNFIAYDPDEDDQADAPVQKPRDGSFLSVYHILSRDSLAGDEIRPLQDGNILSLSRIYNNGADVLDRESSNRIETNLKWADNAIGRRKVAAYIKQLCLQSLAEAAARGVEHISWNFSFPTAFSREQQTAFQQTCDEAVADTYENTCYTLEDGSVDAAWPESKASAYHFNKLGHSDTNLGDGAICLDIGAGTTDVSIISGQPGRIVYHTSLQFAGRYLFDPIYKSYDIFSNKSLPDFHGKLPETAVVDADLREHSEEYLRNLKNLTGRAEVRTVLQASQLAVAGIFYYLGTVLAVLAEKGVYTERHVPDIFVGGNGSRIFHWLTGGSFNAKNDYLRVFTDMLASASGLEDTSLTSIRISDRPKIEVAAGMIEDPPQNDEDFFNAEKQCKALFGGERIDEYIAASDVAGDAWLKDGHLQTPETFLSAYDITQGIQVRELPVLRRFLKDFDASNHIWSDGIGLSSDAILGVEKRVNSYYVSEKGKDIKKIFVEPVFIMGLRKMMEVIPHVNK